MATRIAVEREVAAAPATVFAVLADRDCTQRRMALDLQMQAHVSSFDTTDHSLQLVVDAHLPASWMPPGFNSTPELRRTEEWRTDGSDYVGTLGLVVKDLPVRCVGELGLLSWQGGSVLSFTVELAVDVPFLGPTIERMIRDRMEPAFVAELAFIAEQATGSATSG